MTLTFARCDCRLFFASVVSDMRLEKHTLTPLNWFHISLDVVLISTSISSLSRWEAARWLCECKMLSSENLDHDSGRESLDGWGKGMGGDVGEEERQRFFNLFFNQPSRSDCLLCTQ